MYHPMRSVYQAGQNLHVSKGFLATGEAILVSWADNELNNYDKDTKNCINPKICGHYTQVMWKDSVHLGCATAKVPEGACKACTTDCLSNFNPGVNWDGAYISACQYRAPGNCFPKSFLNPEMVCDVDTVPY